MAGHRTSSARCCWQSVQLIVAIVLFSTGFSVDATATRKSFSSHFAPNFDPEYPHFTPFNANDFIGVDTEASAPPVQATPHPAASVVAQKLFSSSLSHKRLSSAHKQPAAPDRSEPELAAIDDSFGVDDIKPFQSFVMDMYKNYRQVYHLDGNQTIGSMLGVSPAQLEEVVTFDQHEPAEEQVADVVEFHPATVTNAPINKLRRKFKPKRKHHQQHNAVVRQPPKPNQIVDGDEVKYNVGPGVNIGLERSRELVNVYLDEDCLKDVFTGRGRKHDLISKILPLFILPFLIQSAIIPFAVTTLKLLLVKSILVGKLAIFLLIISALKNHHQKYSTYDAPPSYVVDPPSRRSETAGGPVGPGYRVEGKPTTWVN